MKLPARVNILSTVYKIEYVDKPSDVDILHKESLWGQVDYWARTIRIYKKDLPDTEIFKTVLHEVIHCVLDQLGADKLNDNEVFVEQLANMLTDTFIRNGL